MKPLELGPNQIARFYRGGARIAAFRRLPPPDHDAPEDWVASTTTVFGEEELGLTRLDGGVRLADVLSADPEAFFEPEHLAAYGPDPALLLKLLDAGERLPLHFHPDAAFAAEHLGVPHGKTEAWIILEAEPDATVHVGFSRDIGEDELAELVAVQELEPFLQLMHRRSVRTGEAIYVPAGVPHVIGAGILLLELQEPADLSLLLEWEGAMPEERAYLGLPRDVALGGVERGAVDIARLTRTRGTTLFPQEADRYFRAELVEPGEPLEPAFSVLVVTDGEGELRTERAEPVRVTRGATVLVPFGSGAAELTGTARAIRCRPPSPG